MDRIALVLVLVVSAGVTQAQTAERREPTGAVTGHVMCADTQRPARLAQVKLVRVPGAVDLKEASRRTFNDSAPSSDAVETGLDGSYTVRNVRPGDYYVVVDYEGYLLPLGNFTLKELTDQSALTKALIARQVRPVRVQADQTVVEDVTLERGASVSGAVSYDDGSPAAGIGIKLLQKDASGKWVQVMTGRYRENFGFVKTNDYGRYRMIGLPAGEYATEADLTLSDHTTTFGPMPGSSSGMIEIHSDKTRFSLPIYSGDKLRKPDAVAYSLGRGEARAGSDLVFPLAKLHKVGGQLLAKDGHPVNGGEVQLLYPDDRSMMTEASVQFDDATFRLEFVPEGEYLLKVSGAKDLTRIQVENAPGFTPRFHEETKTLKTYGDAEQALTVKGDASDVNIVVPAAKGTQ